MEPRRILVVANQTACGDELLDAVRGRMVDGPCRFTLLVPATPPAEHATWTEGEAQAIARRRMEAARRAASAAAGVEVDGLGRRRHPGASHRRRAASSIPTTRSSCRRCRPASRGGCGRTCPSASGSASPCRSRPSSAPVSRSPEPLDPAGFVPAPGEDPAQIAPW